MELEGFEEGNRLKGEGRMTTFVRVFQNPNSHPPTLRMTLRRRNDVDPVTIMINRWERELILRYGYGNGLGVAADGGVFGGTGGGAGEPFTGGLVVALSPSADDVANGACGLFCRQLFTDPVDPLASFITSGGVSCG